MSAIPALLSTAACEAARTPVSASQTAAPTGEELVAGNQSTISQRFRNLDEYLLWLEQHEAPLDGGWYKEIRTGVYEWQTGGNLHLDVPETGKRVFTREELERKFGFKK